MTEPTRTPFKNKLTLMQEHGITSLAAPTQADRLRLAAMTPAEQKAMYEQELLSGLEGEKHRKMTFAEIKADAMKHIPKTTLFIPGLCQP